MPMQSKPGKHLGTIYLLEQGPAQLSECTALLLVLLQSRVGADAFVVALAQLRRRNYICEKTNGSRGNLHRKKLRGQNAACA